MKSHFVLAIVGVVAAPFVVQETVGTLDPALASEDTDLYAKAQEIARKEFAVNGSLTAVRAWVDDERVGTFGEPIRPDPGYAFHYVQARITNVGKMDFAVSTWHFSGLDEAGSDHGVELGNAHEDFDASRLGKGQSRDGVVIFELRKGSHLTGIVWQGDLANATASVPPYEFP